jgi:hypothetical protein
MTSGKKCRHLKGVSESISCDEHEGARSAHQIVIVFATQPQICLLMYYPEKYSRCRERSVSPK